MAFLIQVELEVPEYGIGYVNVSPEDLGVVNFAFRHRAPIVINNARPQHIISLAISPHQDPKSKLADIVIGTMPYRQSEESPQ